MELAVATLINTFILSSMYILVALGFAFLFSMLGIVNFAHGAIYMIGGYTSFALITALGINNWLALIFSVIIMAAVGVFIEKFCFRPFVGNFNRTAVMCVFITVVLQTTVNIWMGTKVGALPPFMEGTLKAGFVSVSYERVITAIIAAVLLVVIIWFVTKTKWGQQMQAVAQNREGAALQGINVHGVSALACAIGCGLAAISGNLMGAYSGLVPFMGDSMLTKVLIVVMLAGVGSIKGIFITGFILGLMNAFLPVIMNGAASEAVSVAIVVVLLLVRPQGFFGREVEM